MTFRRIALIDNLQDPERVLLQDGYDGALDKYMLSVGGNTGNVAFVHGVRKISDEPLTRVQWGWSGDAVREVADVIVIACANQIGAHADLRPWADALERFGLPVVLVGLGAQTPNYETGLDVPDGTIRFLDVVNDHRPSIGSNIGVRGPFTESVLSDVGFESVSLGCPSLFISSESYLGARIAERSADRGARRLAIAAGNPFHLMNRVVEKQMIELCNEFDGGYFVQHPDSVVGLALSERMVPDEKVSLLGELLGFADSRELINWFGRNAYAFHDVHAWMHVLRHYDAVLGARYHGVALGVQVGIPGRVIHIDNRTRELASVTGIPSTGVEELVGRESCEVARSALWDDETGVQFDRNRHNRASDMVRFLQDNGVVPSSSLRRLSNLVSAT